MDFLQAWGANAPALFYLWISVAYGVAYLRTRKTGVKDRASGLFLIAMFALIQPLSLFHGFEENPSTMWWVNYGLYLCWPLVLLGIFHGIGKQGQTIGYRHPVDVLLFRPPRWTEDAGLSGAIQASRPSYFLATVLLVLFAALLAGVSYIGVGLQLCQWLDVSLGRSGCLRSLQVDRESIQSVAFSPSGKLLAIASSEPTIRLYRVDDGTLQSTLHGHTDWVTSVVFSPDGAVVASGSWDGTIRLWNSSNGTLIQQMQVPVTPGNATIHIAFSPDGALLASAAYKTDVRLWRVSDGTLLRTIPSGGTAVAFSPDSSLLAAEGPNNTIILSHIQDGSKVATLSGHTYNIRSLAFSFDGSILASAGSDDTIRLWQVSNGTLLHTLPTRANWDIAFSPDGQFLVSGGSNGDIQRLGGNVEIWQTATGQRLRQWEASRTQIESVAFSPVGNIIASASSFEVVRLWRILP